MTGGPILVTGAAGKTGLAVIRALAHRGEPVRALVRTPEQEGRVVGAGARDATSGDLRDRRTLDRAVAGVRAVYLICPNMSPDEEALAGGVIAACRGAGVERLVYHSVLHPQVEAMPHHWAKMRVEETLFTSGLAWTILQPAAYMQNLLAGWSSIVDEGRYRVPYAAETRLGMVDLLDVAEVAAKVLGEDGHEGAIYELAGAEVLTQTEIAARLTEAVGRSVTLEVAERSEWRREALAAGQPEPAVESLLAMFRYYEDHGFWGNPRALQHLLGRAPTPLATFLKRSLADR